MNPALFSRHTNTLPSHQRGTVLFFALVALVVMSLAAVALIRSTDTSTMIAGNLALKQAATTAGDAGVEAAANWLLAEQSSPANAGKTVIKNADHTFNVNSAANADHGYYATIQNTFNWDDAHSALVGTDANRNTIKYIIDRMCSEAGKPNNKTCLYSTKIDTSSSFDVKTYTNFCPDCLLPGQSPMLRITAQITGPKNTISYIQSFVY
jgi:Tfp pilus assembly protein PilX